MQDRGCRTDTGSDLDSDDSSNAKDNSDNDVARPKYTGVKSRAKNKYLQSGWSDEGKTHYKYLLTQIRSRDKDNTENAGEYRRVWLRHYGNSFVNKKDNVTQSEPQQDTEERREAPIMFSDDEDIDGEEDNEIEVIKNRTFI